MNDTNVTTQMNAAQTLGDIGGCTAVPALIDALLGNHEWVSIDAAVALGKLKCPEAVLYLIKTLHLPSFDEWHEQKFEHIDLSNVENRLKLAKLYIDVFDLKVVSAQALGLIGDERAVPALVQVLQGNEPVNLKEAAANALEKINSPEANAAHREWKEQQKGEI
ncbi:MAG: HEAT repeat domain-containing protein [Chloroflexi bacterium]|nr:HEAT repeat domain-containing protein [Chloroflexota bacterium]